MIRPVTITAVLNGWSVNVGCQTLVFEDTDRLINAVRNYLKFPEENQTYWLTAGLNAKQTMGAPTPQAMAADPGERDENQARSARPLTR